MNLKNTKRSSNYMFVRRVLKSCKKIDHLEMAEKMIWQYATNVRIDDSKSAEDLMKIYNDKKRELTICITKNHGS